jgi:hypothetical protein
VTRDQLDALARSMGARFDVIKNSTKVRLVKGSATDADFARLEAACRDAGVPFFSVKETHA